MHWLLSVPDAFSLRQVIRQSGWLLHRPLAVQPPGDRLTCVEQVTPDVTIELALYQVSTGLVVQTSTRLSGPSIEEVSRRIWRMVRLDQDLRPFVRLARAVEPLTSVTRWGARLLRGTTLFQDLLTATTAMWRDAPTPVFPALTLLVDRLGSPLPSNPTLHAFPGPQQVLEGLPKLAGILDPAELQRIAAVSQSYLARGPEIERLDDRMLSSTEFAAALSERVPLDETGLGLMMLLLGRYDYVPTDGTAEQRLIAYRHSFRRDLLGDVIDFRSRWQPWSGLAYWLWDWPALTASPAAEKPAGRPPQTRAMRSTAPRSQQHPPP